MQHVLAVHSAKLNAKYPATEFIRLERRAILDLLMECGLWIGPRGHLENDSDFRQIIPYVTIRSNEKYLAYERSTHGAERRLHGAVSIGIGGHIDFADVSAEGNIIDLERTVELAAARECEEEVGRLDIASSEWSGLVLDYSNDVGRVHLGVVINYNIVGEILGGFDKAVTKLEFRSPKELAAIRSELEGWSRLLLPDESAAGLGSTDAI